MTTSLRYRSEVSAALIAVAGLLPTIADAESARAIEEVIVTAERQAASIQDTSISITAFTGDQLEAFGIRNQEDLQNFIPATTLQPYDATIRGVGRNFRALGGDPGVATYMNGIYSEDLLTATAATFWDVERIEVLRGPQGTLYGRNAIGGAINILYNPAEQEFDYGFKAIAGNFDTQEVYGMINGAIIPDILAGRLSFSYRDRDGVIENAGPGDDLDGLGTENVALQLSYTPSDTLAFALRANLMEIDRPFGGADGGGLVVLNEEGGATRNTTNAVTGYRRIDTANTDPANYDQHSWYDVAEPILIFIDPDSNDEVQAQHNRAGIDPRAGRNPAASLDGLNQTSQASADALNECVFPGSIDGDDVCAPTNGLNREQFDQQGVQFSGAWDLSDNLQIKYLYGYNKLSYQRTTDDDLSNSQFVDTQFYVNHEARYDSHEVQAFYNVNEKLSFTSGLFTYNATIDQRGDFYSTVFDSREAEPYVDNTGLAGAFFGTGPMETLHSAKAACLEPDPAPSCAVNYALANPLDNNNLRIAQWYGDDGTNPDLSVAHGIRSRGSSLLYHTQTKRDSFAAYTQGVWDIDDKFTLTFGLRFAEDVVEAEENVFQYLQVASDILENFISIGDYNRVNGGLLPDPTAPTGERATEIAVQDGIPVSLSVYRNFERKDQEITGRINLDWNLSERILLYLSATTGYRSGGYNLVFFSATPTYEPEELISYEFGFKTLFRDDTLQLNGSLYLYDYDSIHTVGVEVAQLVPGEPPGLTDSVLAAPGAKIWGVEAEVLWLATAAWTIGSNFSFTPSEYTDDLFLNDDAASETPRSIFDTFFGLTQNIEGNQLPQVPEWKYTGWATYRWPFNNGSNLDVTAVYSWIDEVYYSPFENDAEKAAAYDRIDLRATWTSNSRDWVVSTYVHNLLDEVGVIKVDKAGEGGFFRQSAGVTAPRMYGIEVSYLLGD